MNKRYLLLNLALLLSALPLLADGGMWTLDQLQTQLPRMKELGFKLDGKDIYDPSGAPSLKDAVVFFDGGCSGVLVSPQALLLTNHHCGYDQIQALSSVEANYLRDGYMSHSIQEELPCPGLEVEIVDEIREVTNEVKALLSKNKSVMGKMDYLSPRFLSGLAPEIVGKKAAKRPGYRYEIKAFYGGNKYYMFTNKVFKDVRLVATPPSSIGKYGADTDNWIWPRHTGDFSIFRIYADKKGNPSAYSKDNVPFQPKKWVQVSGKGIKEGDFAMVLGFPGTTYHYFTGDEVKEWGEIDNNIRIEMRGIRQEIMMAAMRADEKTEIMYSAKYASSQNGYKRAQGANWAIEKRHLEAIKTAQQNALLERSKAAGSNLSAAAVDEIAKAVAGRRELRYRQRYLQEAILMGIEFVNAPIPAVNLSSLNGEKQQQAIEEIRKSFDSFFNKDYSPELDKRIALAMLERYCQRIPEGQRPDEIDKGLKQFGSIEKYLDHIFENSVYASREKFEACLAERDYKKLETDPMAQFAASVLLEQQVKLPTALQPFDASIAAAQQDYIKANMEFADGVELWPDANLTLRFTFGKVQGYKPRDVVTYGCLSTLAGVIEKEDPTNPEYIVPERLKEIYLTKDYGRYGDASGTMPVNLCATTHTTGGNSGSPVLNASGELVGLNFDRNWEGVGGDIEYLADYQRSIILDTRYLLLIVDKYFGGERLVKEMNPQF